MFLFPDFFPATPAIIQTVCEYSDQAGVDPALVLGVIEQESHFDPLSEKYEDRYNDYSAGLMQLMTNTAISLGFKSSGNVETDKETLKADINQNIFYGIKYLKSRMVTYKNLPLIDQVRCYNSGSPLSDSSPYYNDNQAYGNNVMTYYAKWQVRLSLGTRSNLMENIVFAGVLGGMCIYLDRKLNTKG